MDDIKQGVVDAVSNAFRGASGPARFKFPEEGWWFESEGKGIARALLDLDPEDLQYDEIVNPMDGSFLPAWTTGEGLLWLVPGMIRVMFEVDPKAGDHLIQRVVTELHKRTEDGELSLTKAQMESLSQAHEVFYCTEDFGWDPSAHAHPFFERRKPGEL